MGDRFVRVDPARPDWSADRIVRLNDRLPIDAIVPVDDRGIVMAAVAADRLALPHNTPAAVRHTRDKLEMRRHVAASAVAQPPFVELSGPDPVAAIASGVGFPAVVKPRRLTASRGVIRVDGADEVPAVVERIRDIVADAGGVRTESLLAEAFVAGDEVAVEAVLHRGDLEVLALLDKPDPLDGPFFAETMFVTPSRHPAAVQDRLARDTAAAAAALNLTDGPIHAEFRIGDGDPTLLEVAARSIGGLCGRALRFGLLGASLEVVLLRHALGFPPVDVAPSAPASGVMMLPVPRAGVLEMVDGTASASRVAGVVDLELTITPGTYVEPLPEGDRYLGFLYARAAEPAAVEAALRTAFGCLDIRISPVAPGATGRASPRSHC
jgi:biotin carboxylase